ncbi:MAG: flagellar motor protein MotB [bacterium]|nr:flagellar motor protein MotB [bacterium]
MARKRKKEAHGGGGVHAPAWMISWADLTTLLWACFVLLWSFSTLDLAKFQKAASSLHGAFGVLQGGAMVLEPGEFPDRNTATTVTAGSNRMDQMRQRIKEEAKEEGFENSISASISDKGLTIRFADSALFDPGSVELKPGVIPVLDYVAGELAAINNPVQVEGHTDTTPINTPKFPSNWELSTGRAITIVHYMIEQGEIDPVRLSAAGYAFYHPVALNNTPEGRARNRRVDIIVLNPAEEEAVSNHQDALSFLESDESSGIVMPPADESAVSAGSSEEEVVSNHQGALSFLEGDESSGIVIPPVDESAGSSDTGENMPDENDDST